jgi:peptidoglycan/xylan/chitin deacetylase (PgdA/CDA1 family)
VRVRSALKPAIAPLAWRPLLASVRASDRRAGVILLYHAIGDRDGDRRRELVPPISRARLRRQLAHLRRHYALTELDGLQAAVAARRRGDPFPVALTFDDDLGSHVTHALPELQAANAPATFFLCGAFRDFWWQRLQRAVDRHEDVSFVGAGTIHELGDAIEALGQQERDAVAQRLAGVAGPAAPGEVLTAEDARRLPRTGFHTVRHDPLTRLDDDQLARALSEGREEQAEIAYPHGYFDERVADAARRAGFRLGLTCERTAVTPHSDPLRLGRYEPPPHGSMGEFAFDLVRTLLITPT